MTADHTLLIRGAPHITAGKSVNGMMRHVIVALLPVCVFAVYIFGITALAVIATATVACVVVEHTFCLLAGRPTTIGDGSAAVTGILYGLTLPPTLPLWMVVVGAVCAIGIGKTLFGGLGFNPFNPALVGRAILQAAFPVAMTSWPSLTTARFTTVPVSSLVLPFAKPEYDAISGATPLAKWKFEQIAADTSDLLLGTTGGSTGETSALIILLGGVYLIWHRVLNWRIPVAILLTVGIASLVMNTVDPDRFQGPLFMLFSGGLMLGAIFMATDPVGSPMTHAGCCLYGVLIGALVVAIRGWGGMPEGVMYSILIANAVSPHIDYCIQPRVYGVNRRERTHG